MCALTDAIIIGGSSLDHITANIAHCSEGPLDQSKFKSHDSHVMFSLQKLFKHLMKHGRQTKETVLFIIAKD